MIYGYARVSTTDQDLSVQLDFLKNYTDFQKFEKEVERLSNKDKEQIAWWWNQCANHLKPSLENFMN